MKNEKLKNALIVVGLVIAAGVIIQLFLSASNIGMAPSGGSAAEVEANFKKMDAKARIDIIKSSPASPDRKAQLISDIEKETGYKDNGGENVGGGTETHPANAPGLPGNKGSGADK